MLNKIYLWISSKRLVRSSKLVAWLLFGFWPRTANRVTLWDNTTILFRKALDKWIKPNQKVLEIGTGDVAILSIHIVKRKQIKIIATDVVTDFVHNAKYNLNIQKLEFQILQSNLFSNISGTFDVIFFNPPYVPSHKINLEKQAKYHGFKSLEMVKISSDGGNDGLNVIKAFFTDASQFLKKDGHILLGVNLFHIDFNDLKKIIKKFEMRIIDRLGSKYSECVIFKIKARADI